MQKRLELIMPLTETGRKVMASMKKKYGKRGGEVFYASVNKGIPGSQKWHEKGKPNKYSDALKGK